jgi:aconitate hydratase
VDGESASALGLKGDETYSVAGLSDDLKPGDMITVTAKGAGDEKTFKVHVRIDTPVEVHYYRNGGILRAVLRRLAE